jgi:VanZ family protein
MPRQWKPSTKPATRGFSKVLALSFVLFLLLIITVANRGDGDQWWSFVHKIPYGDKLGHIGLMGTLGFLCNLAFTPRTVPFLPSFITRATCILVLLVTTEELSQAFISTRTCDPLDWLANLTGLSLGQLAALALTDAKNPEL